MGQSQTKQVAGDEIRTMIHYRPINQIRAPGIMTAHWCLQAGEKFYQLKSANNRPEECKSLPVGSTFDYEDGSVRMIGKKIDMEIGFKERGCGNHSNWKTRDMGYAAQTWDTVIDKQAKEIFNQRFLEKYDLFIENCHTFAIFLFMGITLRDTRFSHHKNKYYKKGKRTLLAANMLAYLQWYSITSFFTGFWKLAKPWMSSLVRCIDPDKIDWGKLTAPNEMVQLNQAQITRLLQQNVYYQLELQHRYAADHMTTVNNLLLQDANAANLNTQFITQQTTMFAGMPP